MTTPRIPRTSDTRLADVLDQQRDEERQRAARALLRHPLLTPQGPDAAAFGLARRHAAWLADWFARETGWSVTVDSGVARLRKTTTRHVDRTRGAAHGNAKAKTLFSRRRYVLACLALAALERAETQVTLGWLVDRVLALATDERLAEAGVTFTLDTREERADLVAVARLLLGLGVLRKVAGDEQAFVNRSGDALYDLDRRVLASLLVTRRGPSTVVATDPADRLRAVSEDRLPDTEDGRNRAVRHALARRLLDDPVVLYSELSEDERGYLDRQRGPLLRRLTDATGLAAEVRAEGVALLDPTGEATDLGMPEEGTDGHATLLLAEHLAAAMRAGTGDPMAIADIELHMRDLVREHGNHWRNDAKAPGAEHELTAHALHRLEALGLVRREGERVTASPVLARYHYADATVLGGDAS
jgi:uncharacterized protein (TIGR02678 family)